MTKDEFITQFDEYVDRRSEQRERLKGLPSIFDATVDDLSDSYMPGETEKPTTDMSLDSILRWLIRRSLLVFKYNASAARNWFYTSHQELKSRPIDLISNHPGAISVFNALPERHPLDFLVDPDNNDSVSICLSKEDEQWLNKKPEDEI